MIINLKQTPSKDDDGLFKENNIKKVNIQEFSVDNEETESYTLEGISGMVLMDKDEVNIKKGESATSGSRSENSEMSDSEKEQQIMLMQS